MPRLFRSLLWLKLLLLYATLSGFLSAEENFVVLSDLKSNSIYHLGPHVEEEITPCSTFKIALSLMGFDAGILHDESSPVWPYLEGYPDFLETWKVPHSPKSWMKNSVVWFSHVLTAELGLDKLQDYLDLFNYGNRDLSGGQSRAWLSSTLKISPIGQVMFLRKLIMAELPLTSHAIMMTKQIMYIEEMPGGWRLHGKTGWGSMYNQESCKIEIGWFVGWIERCGVSYPFAYCIREDKIDLGARIPRAKQLLLEALPHLYMSE